jgi:exodeoxyribonuclease III
MFMKIISWNVNGIRALNKKPEFDWLFNQKADFICLQETKAHPDQLSNEILNPKGYLSYFDHSKTRKGYSGVVIYTKEEPLKVIYGLGKKDLDLEGRQISLIYKDFILVNCYFPNGGGEDYRLQYKLNYFDEFLKFIKKLEKINPNIIFCGDINIAHNEIDLARPKENSKEIGFLPIERAKLDKFYENHFVDVFRELHPKKVQYSWWDMKTRARDRNVGWRIDYFWTSKNLLKKVKQIKMQNEIFGSDHCPIVLEIKN